MINKLHFDTCIDVKIHREVFLSRGVILSAQSALDSHLAPLDGHLAPLDGHIGPLDGPLGPLHEKWGLWIATLGLWMALAASTATTGLCRVI